MVTSALLMTVQLLASFRVTSAFELLPTTKLLAEATAERAARQATAVVTERI
jgi:hypothetical protein